MRDFYKLAKTLNYWELCCIEDALNEYLKNHSVQNDLAENEKVENLIQTVRNARGWVHHFNKTDRE